jgi:hypothetical protein
MQSFQQYQRMYREQHSTLGCKITHMFGVPLIALSLPMFLVHWPTALTMAVIGWILQFIGHYVFQKNSPVFFGNPLNPYTYITAVLFVADEWYRLLSGKSLAERAN